MTNKKILLLFCLGFVIFVGVFFAVKETNNLMATKTMQAEHEIYTLLLSNQRNAYSDVPDAIQLVEVTNSGKLQFGNLGNTEPLTEEQALMYFPSLEKKTFLDFQKKNAESYPIKNYLPDFADVIFVNPDDGNQVYWWVSYSRIGFNPSITQALILVGDCRGTSCYYSADISMYSAGFYLLLEKENENWAIKDSDLIWHLESVPH